MNTVSFYAAIFLALIYAAIMVGQARESRALDEAMAQQHSFQIKLLQAEEKNQFTHQLVQRIAGESTGDPALADLLKDNGVKVSYNNRTPDASPTTLPNP